MSAGSVLAVLATVAVAGVAGALIPRFPTTLVIAAVAAASLIAAIAVHPPLAAYTVIGVTPLVVGIDRGSLIPLFRPSEALLLLAGLGLAARGLLRAVRDGVPEPTLRRSEISILLVCIASSVIPLLWMLMRGARIEGDDVLYALVFWKFFGIYIIIRCSVRTAAQTRTCLYVAMSIAGVVAVISICQALQVFGVAQFLQHNYAAFGNEKALLLNRGGATLGLPIAAADLFIFNIAIAFSLFIRRGSHAEGRFLAGISVLLVAGVLAAGQFTGVVALVLTGMLLARLAGAGRYLLRMVPVLIVAGWLLQPVLDRRLDDVNSDSGLPVSWIGRLDNLRTFFWPRLFSGFNYILGVRPSARVPTPKYATGWVWIESGYTWLLWAGGIPLILAFCYFVGTNVRGNWPRAQYRGDAIGAAALAVVVSLSVVAVCMLLDPHLAYRGSGDLLFVLLALAAVRVDEARSTGPPGAAVVEHPRPRAPDRHVEGRREDRRRPVRRPTRVLIVIENVALARDHRARKQAATLAAAGCVVSVICRRDARNRGFPGLEGVRIYEYRGPREARSKVGFLWEYGYSLVAAFVLCVRAKLGPGFDVMQVGNPPDAQYLLAMPFRLFGCRLIVDQRDLSPEVYRDRYGKDHGLLWRLIGSLERRSWRAADHIVTVNSSLVDTIVERGGVPRESVTVVGNGPRRDRPADSRPELKHGKQFLVMWLGLMGPQDHADLALEAAHDVVTGFGRTDCHFVFVGDGEELPALRRQASELGIDDVVTFTGWLNEVECVEYLAQTDLALDSNLQQEVTPVKGLEYMSFGVPMVAFDLRETRLMAERAAAYVPAGDAHALAAQIVALLDDPARRVEMGAIGLRRIDETYSWERQAVRYRRVFEQARPVGLRAVGAAPTSERQPVGAGAGPRGAFDE